MKKRDWLVFLDTDGKELLAITANEADDSEILSTIDLLAYEKHISAGSISIAEVRR